MLDSSLAVLYQIDTKYIIRAVKRNIQRFPVDFAFHLSTKEVEIFCSLKEISHLTPGTT